jgi:hypothetical protein
MKKRPAKSRPPEKPPLDTAREHNQLRGALAEFGAWVLPVVAAVLEGKGSGTKAIDRAAELLIEAHQRLHPPANPPAKKSDLLSYKELLEQLGDKNRSRAEQTLRGLLKAQHEAMWKQGIESPPKSKRERDEALQASVGAMVGRYKTEGIYRWELDTILRLRESLAR